MKASRSSNPRAGKVVCLSLVRDARVGDESSLSTECRATVQHLETLLTDARAGRVSGIAYAAVLSDRGYIINTAGVAENNPTFARGMLRALDDQLARAIGSQR